MLQRKREVFAGPQQASSRPIMPTFAGRQVVPVDCTAEVSQHLLEASLSGDLESALECIADPSVDVNYVGAVTLKFRRSDVVLRGESPSDVRVNYEEFRTDVTALFLAVHTRNVALVKKLLRVGVDVNQKLFKGYAITEAVREGHHELLEILIKAGADQSACEDALLEGSCHGRARLVELLMGSDLIRPHVAVHALVTASCRGFVDVVDALIKCGVDPSASVRFLLQSSKPSLHINIECTALIAAVVNRQVNIVHMLLQGGVKMDVNVRLGAWSWDRASDEEFRVGAGLAEPYPIIWCAVEYYEASGTILRILLQHVSPNKSHYGRTLLHHAILCSNLGAVHVLLNSGADKETSICTTTKTSIRPIHMAARLGHSVILQCLIDFGCDLNSMTSSGDTALIMCVKKKHTECLKALTMAGADFGLVNSFGQSASSIAGSNRWNLGFQQCIIDVIRAGKVPYSSNLSIFCPLLLAAQAGDIDALKTVIKCGGINLDYQDENGFSAVMIAALKGHVEAFRLLVYSGADVKLLNKAGETAITISELNPNRDQFEKVMLEFTLEKDCRIAWGFYALHFAARRGDLDAVKLLVSRGYDVNIPDGEGYTPLMLAAREGHKSMCQLLISSGACCDFKNSRGESALSLASKCGSMGNGAANVILDGLARNAVLGGARVWKHTKGGKGSPHQKQLKMLRTSGVLSWGRSSGRNVICREAYVGPSPDFQRNRLRKGSAVEPGAFRVVTSKNKEFHFVCEGGTEAAKLWVRGIKLVTAELIGK